jgi:DNA-binding MltR family transcriptional regulator
MVKSPRYLEQEAAITEIMGQTDRAAAIVAFAYLETILDDTLRGRLFKVRFGSEDILDSLFTGAGALATFSARNRLAYAMGIYGKETYADLRRLAHIRNEFAHQHAARTFGSKRISDLCNALTVVKAKPTTSEHSAARTRWLYITATIEIAGMLTLVSDLLPKPPKVSELVVTAAVSRLPGTGASGSASSGRRAGLRPRRSKDR